MSFLQVTPTSLFQRTLFIEPFHCVFMVGEKIIWTVILKKTGRSDKFSELTRCQSGFCKSNVNIELHIAFNNISVNINNTSFFFIYLNKIMIFLLSIF